MATTASIIDVAARAQGFPILGVSIGNLLDRATWRLQYTADATDLQKAAGDAWLQTFDPTSAAALTTAADLEAQAAIDGLTALKAAVICSLWGRLGRQPTAAEISAERARFITIYKAL